jgi:hypothetical protein
MNMLEPDLRLPAKILKSADIEKLARRAISKGKLSLVSTAMASSTCFTE